MFNAVVEDVFFEVILTDICTDLKQSPDTRLQADEIQLNVVTQRFALSYTKGSCVGLEIKTSLEKSLNFTQLRKSLNCFGK